MGETDLPGTGLAERADAAERYPAMGAALLFASLAQAVEACDLDAEDAAEVFGQAWPQPPRRALVPAAPLTPVMDHAVDRPASEA
jgi:hypothetical protein